MKETIEKVKAWFMANKAVGIIAGLLVLFFVFKKLKGRAPRRRRRLPRSVGMRRARRSPARKSFNRIIRTGRNRGKKAWQIKGSPEARARMAKLRRMRSKKLF